jgi:hypothetical protein
MGAPDSPVRRHIILPLGLGQNQSNVVASLEHLQQILIILITNLNLRKNEKRSKRSLSPLRILLHMQKTSSPTQIFTSASPPNPPLFTPLLLLFVACRLPRHLLVSVPSPWSNDEDATSGVPILMQRRYIIVVACRHNHTHRSMAANAATMTTHMSLSTLYSRQSSPRGATSLTQRCPLRFSTTGILLTGANVEHDIDGRKAFDQ